MTMLRRHHPLLFLLPLFLTPALTAGCSGAGPEAVIRIHYLGHAAFLLTCDNGLTVLTDYGESNAYGLDSPVHAPGSLTPDVVTISHAHPDHAGGTLPPAVGRMLRDGEGFEGKGLRLTAIPTFEQSLAVSDNFSYLFEYGGLKVLHLGDCQALMTGLGEPGIRDRVRTLYPDTYDLVLLPIGFVRDILEEAAAFAALLDARRMVPMHFWSPADRDRFLELMAGRTDSRERAYRVRSSPAAGLSLMSGEAVRDPAVEVIGLTPAPLPAAEGPCLGQGEPPDEPRLFAPGIVSSLDWEHSTPVFTRGGTGIYWTTISDRARIMHSERLPDGWAPRAVAPWSGTWDDFYPFPADDGRRLYFSSYRPWEPGGENPGYGITIWYVDRTTTGWAEPVMVGAPVATGGEFAFSLSSDGTLYFTRGIDGVFDLFRAEATGDGFGPPERLPDEVNSPDHEDGPFITPDGRVLLFESLRETGMGGADLYVAVRRGDGTWSPAVNLGPAVNTPSAERFARLSPDGCGLFFGSDRNGDRGDVFWIAVEEVEPLRRVLR